MKTRKEAIEYCMKLDNTYEDYPFNDKNWTLMRHNENKKVFAWIFNKDDHIWMNVKCEPDWLDFYRQNYSSIVPAFHLNKDHWNSIILDGTIPDEIIYDLIRRSYHLTKKK
ncbi:MmcQ/YjbR family DNA-binding protein [Bacillus timonensis]|uniref:MmcQ/YjbR family DNA-binding protein n=1 Tax=Bacillus timonensis TaxID=1033734 RepID=UPI00028A010A|nr:MmcQ/YjbR family DNA-binding protein [Bacillus timonensis]